MNLKKTLKDQHKYIKRLLTITFNNSDIRIKLPGSTLLAHGGLNVVIGSKVKIGENCYIRQGVTIGNRNHKSCIIEDNVILGSHAVVIGSRVGHDSIVGAGAVVTHDVPPYSLVVGFNRVIKDKYRKNMGDE